MVNTQSLYFGLTGVSKVPQTQPFSPETEKAIHSVLLSIKHNTPPMVLNGRKFIQLRQTKSLISMAGVMFAEQILATQIQPYLTSSDYQTGFTLVMPEHVILVAPSFIDHIVGTMASNFKTAEAFRNFEFHSENIDVQRDIDEAIANYSDLKDRKNNE